MRLPSSLFFILLVFINGFISTANAAADLSLNVSADVGSFSILVTNDGSENAHGVTVKLSNACLNYSFYSYSRNGRRVNCTASTVDIGSVISGRTTKVYLPFTYKVNQAQSIVAEIFSSSRYDIDSTPNNNQAAEDDQVTVSVPARPVATTHNGLAISITPTGSSTRIHWTYHPIQVSLENTNSAEISNIEFRMDAHAQQLTLQSIEGDGEIIYATDDEGNVLHYSDNAFAISSIAPSAATESTMVYGITTFGQRTFSGRLSWEYQGQSYSQDYSFQINPVYASHYSGSFAERDSYNIRNNAIAKLNVANNDFTAYAGQISQKNVYASYDHDSIYVPNNWIGSTDNRVNLENSRFAVVNGELLFQPDKNISGSASFRYNIADEYGGTNNYSTTRVTLNIQSANTAPVLTSELIKAQAGVALTQQLTATDAESNGISYSASGLPAGLSLSATGTLTGTVSTAGVYSFEISVSDGIASTTETIELRAFSAQQPDLKVLQSFNTPSGTLNQASTLTVDTSDLNSFLSSTSATLLVELGLNVSISNSNAGCSVVVTDKSRITCQLTIAGNNPVSRSFQVTPLDANPILSRTTATKASAVEIDSDNNISELVFYAYKTIYSQASYSLALNKPVNTILVDDLNGDNKDDLLVFPKSDSPIIFYNAANTLSQPLDQLWNVHITAAVSGDIDNDGNVDVFMASTPANNNIIYHYEVNDAGELNPVSEISSVKNQIVSLSLGDTNNDGFKELFVGSKDNGSNNNLIRNVGYGFDNETPLDGTRAFLLVSPELPSTKTANLQLNSLSSTSGYSDIIISTENSKTTVRRNSCSDSVWHRLCPSVITVEDNTDYSRSLSVADVDGSGGKDILIGGSSTNRDDLQRYNKSRLYLNQNNASFSSGIEIFSQQITHTEFVDFDQNGDDDILIANQNGSAQVWLNNDGSFSQSTYTVNIPEDSLVSMALINNDNYPDIIAVSPANGEVKVYLNPINNDDDDNIGTSSSQGGQGSFSLFYLLFIGMIVLALSHGFRVKFR